MHPFIPKTSALVDLARANWKPGLTVALISIPLSIALSIASGAGPIPGIITGIWATMIASFFGGSNYNIIGAAGALATVLFTATLAAPLGLGAAILPILALATGVIILAIWAIGADRFLYYVPSSVMYGFSAGVAFLIAASQLFDATGLSTLKRTGTFFGDIALYIHHATETHLATVAVFGLALAFILAWKRLIKSLPAVIPAAILGIVFGLINESFLHIPLITLGDKFGEVSGALMLPVAWNALPALITSVETLRWVGEVAGVIALIAVLETLITAKMGDKITHTQSSSRQELLGLALANLGSGAMGGLPATGVFVRTGANIKAGATHRMSAFIAALATAIIAVVVLPSFAFLPAAVVAAILVNTGIGLIEVEKFREFWKHERTSFMVALLVATITVIHDAGTAVVVGALLALLLFAESVSRGRFDVVFNFHDGHKEHTHGHKILHIPETQIDVVTYSISGFLSYIDSSRHAANLRHLARSPNVECVIIRMRGLFSVDYESEEMLAEAIEEMERHGKRVFVSSAAEHVKTALITMPAFARLDAEGRFCVKAEQALERAGIPAH